jgi:hypothetical protein
MQFVRGSSLEKRNRAVILTARFLFLLFLFHVDHFAAFIVTATGAHGVRQAHFTAIAALNQVRGSKCVMGAAAITASRAVFTFRLRGH